MSNSPRLLLEELKSSSEEVLNIMSDIIGLNTFFVAINDTLLNNIVKVKNKDEVLVTEGSHPFFESYCSLVIEETNDTLIIPDTVSHSSTGDMQITNELGRASFIGVPIQLRDGTKVGTICGMDRQPHVFSESDIQLLKSMATFLARVIELENMVFQDNLTEAFNRNYIDAFFADSWDDKYDSVGVLFFDFDDFKTINDQFDHNVGDYVLRTVVDRIKNCIREGDVLCRIGGDEFVALILNYRKDEVLLEIIRAIQFELSKPIEVAQCLLHVSTSIGVSRYPHDGTVLEDLIKMADKEMYEVKRKGKNNYSIIGHEGSGVCC